MKPSDAIALRDSTFKFKDRKALAEKSLGERKAREEEQRKKQARLEQKETSHVLTVENLPVQATEEMLCALFGQYPGFKYTLITKKSQSIWRQGSCTSRIRRRCSGQLSTERTSWLQNDCRQNTEHFLYKVQLTLSVHTSQP
jgi:hypothetical protein